MQQCNSAVLAMDSTVQRLNLLLALRQKLEAEIDFETEVLQEAEEFARIALKKAGQLYDKAVEASETVGITDEEVDEIVRLYEEAQERVDTWVNFFSPPPSPPVSDIDEDLDLKHKTAQPTPDEEPDVDATHTHFITSAQLAQSAILHQVGARVLIHSLVSNTELNGLHGRVSAVSPDGACYIVEVENVPTGESRRAFEFSGKNLAAVGAAADAAGAPSVTQQVRQSVGNFLHGRSINTLCTICVLCALLRFLVGLLPVKNTQLYALCADSARGLHASNGLLGLARRGV